MKSYKVAIIPREGESQGTSVIMTSNEIREHYHIPRNRSIPLGRLPEELDDQTEYANFIIEIELI
jgi:hypothetical protein